MYVLQTIFRRWHPIPHFGAVTQNWAPPPLTSWLRACSEAPFFAYLCYEYLHITFIQIFNVLNIIFKVKIRIEYICKF